MRALLLNSGTVCGSAHTMRVMVALNLGELRRIRQAEPAAPSGENRGRRAEPPAPPQGPRRWRRCARTGTFSTGGESGLWSARGRFHSGRAWLGSWGRSNPWRRRGPGDRTSGRGRAGGAGSPRLCCVLFIRGANFLVVRVLFGGLHEAFPEDAGFHGEGAAEAPLIGGDAHDQLLFGFAGGGGSGRSGRGGG